MIPFVPADEAPSVQTGGASRIICTVSTVKDSPANVRRFVEGNLSSGADHMFIFLEGGDEETLGYLAEREHVTVMPTGEEFWGGPPPSNLNVRQNVDANLVNYLLACLGFADWLVHIDGDECLDIDRDALLALDPEVRCVRLDPLESVSAERTDESVELFKRLLTFDELCLLWGLGAIDDPHNTKYFRGHIVGKAAMRPAFDLRSGIHRAKDADGNIPEHLVGDFARVLHYESFSAEEFLRKWETHLAGLGGAGFRAEKQRVKAAVSALLRNTELSAEKRRHYLLELYHRLVADDIDLLLDLELLVRPDPAWHSYRPTAFTADQASLVEGLTRHLVAADKQAFSVRNPSMTPAELLAWLRDRMDPEDPTDARLLALLPEILVEDPEDVEGPAPKDSEDAAPEEPEDAAPQDPEDVEEPAPEGAEVAEPSPDTDPATAAQQG